MNQEKKPAAPRPTLNRLAGVGAAFGLGLWAQSLLRAGSAWDGWLIFALAVGLFVWALRGASASQPRWVTPYRGFFARLPLASQQRQSIGLVLALAAVVTLGLSVVAFVDLKRVGEGWFWHILSLGLAFAAVWIATRPRRPLSLERWRQFWRYTLSDQFITQPRILLLLGIFALAVILRLAAFTSIPFGIWFDEAEAGNQARLWLNNPNYNPVFFDRINVSGQFLWLYSLGLRFVSDSVYGLRFVSVLFGVGSVILAYLLGRDLRGPHFGLAMAFFVAVMRWHINFSRIAMTGIDAPFFILLSLFFLNRLLRFGHLRYAALAGFALGMGLNFYTAFRLFGVALAVSAVLGVIFWPQWRGRAAHVRWWQANAWRLGVVIFFVVLTFAPLMQYALRQPESFNARLQTISIFNRRDTPDLQEALQRNWKQHLGMFHYQGDRNGRHNLPGEPLLDPVMGVLFAFGLGVGLYNLFWGRARPETLLFALLLPIGLAGGVFSVDFEAPQSLRSIATLPAIAYFCALSSLAVGREVRRVLAGLSPQWWVIPAGAIAVYVAVFNAHTYFVRQANDFAVWNAFSTPETLTGRTMAELGPDYDFYLSPFLANHPTIQFVSPETPVQDVLLLPNALPLNSPPDDPAALFVHPDEQQIFDLAQYFYPNALFETLAHEDGGLPAVYIAQFSRDDLASVQGLSLLYWAGSQLDPEANQIPARALKVPTIAVDWRDDPPLEPPFVAVWEGTLYVPQFGRYQLELEAPAEGRLLLNGEEVLSGDGPQSLPLTLPAGHHAFRLEANSGPGVVRLAWRTPAGELKLVPPESFYSDPVSNNGLLGRYFPSPDWTGQPALVKVDAFLDMYFHLTPFLRPYSVIWSGVLQAPTTGVYRLGLRSVGEAELFINGEPILRATEPDRYTEAALTLTAGLQDIEVRFQDTLDRSRIHLYWTPPNQVASTPIPSQFLWPSAASVTEPVPLVDSTTPPPQAMQNLSFSYIRSLSQGLVEPRDMALDSQGRLYVADSGAQMVLVFNEAGEPLSAWASTEDGPLRDPFGVVVDQTDRVWVLDATLQWLYGFNPQGEQVARLGGAESGLYFPRGLSLIRQAGISDTLAVADTGSGRVLFYGLDGSLINIIGSRGDGPGQFNEPVDVLRDNFGTYYVTEGANVERWQRLDALGRSLMVWPLDMPDAINGSRLAFAPDGSILMTNSDLGALLRFSPEGTLLNSWSSLGPISFSRPQGLYFDPRTQRLYLSDLATGQVHVFGVQMTGAE